MIHGNRYGCKTDKKPYIHKISPKKKKKEDVIKEAVNRIMGNPKDGTCCICGTEYHNYGHNAKPVAKGRCCDDCNTKVIIPKREELITQGVEWRKEKGSILRRTVNQGKDEVIYGEYGGDKMHGRPGMMRDYLQMCKESFKKIQKRIPALWRAIMNKRYILPPHRQGDYFSQEACDYLMLDFITEYTQNVSGRGRDEVLNTQWISLIRAFEYDRPTFYLEKELAPKIVAGKLPLDLEIDMIQWMFPSIRVYLPKGFMTIRRQGEDCSLMFMDIVRVEKDIEYNLHKDFIVEIIKEFGDFKSIPLMNAYPGFGVSGNLDFDCPEGPIAYAGTSPINQVTIAKMLGRERFTPLVSTLKSDELDTDFTNGMLTLGLRILMLLSSYEIVPDPPESKEAVIRKPRMEGDRLITGLYNAKFIGEQITKLTESGAKARGLTLPTGIHMSPHWVCGHPKRQPYGPRSENLRKLIWVQPYHTKSHQE
jgi:hypothetical protein